MKCFKWLMVSLLVALVAAWGYGFSGFYPIGADVPHNGLTYWALETVRERSIARASENIDVPGDLQLPGRLLAGGADYNGMCAECHLQPGKLQSDFTLGLYPRPPDLTRAADEHAGNSTQARRQFWIVKHGIKASGMPAWGATHDDERIWNMVAFLQRLPELTPLQYQILTARGDDNTGDQP